MKTKLILVAAMLAGFSLPAVAAVAAAQYYVVKDSATKKCEVSEVKADGKKLMEIGTMGYITKANAEAAMKVAKDCK